MNRTASRLLASLALAASFAAAFAQTEALTFKRVVTAGESAKYKLQVNLEVQGNAIEITATILEKIIALEKDGGYTVEATESEMEFKMGGQSFPTDEVDGTARTTKFNAFGVPLELKGDEEATAAESVRMEFLNIFEYPSAPKKLGDKWTSATKPAATLKGAVPISTDYEFVRTEKLGAWDTAVILAHTKETEGAKPAEAKKTIWVDTKTFAVVKTESKLSNCPLPGMPDPMDISMSFTKQP